MTNTLAGSRSIIVARGRDADGGDQLEQQVRELRAYARRVGIKVVDEVKVANEQANTPALMAALSALFERKKTQDDFNLILLTDLSRITRRGLCHGMHLVRLFEILGVAVATPDTAIIGTSVFNCFHFRSKRWRVRRPERSGKDRQPREEKDQVERNDAPPDARRGVEHGADGVGLGNDQKIHRKEAK